MQILICSDGTAPADDATRLGSVLAKAAKAGVTLLAIEEDPKDERPLREALEKEANRLRSDGVNPQIVIRPGEPIRQIFEQTGEKAYDVAIVGTRGKGVGGEYWHSAKTYELIKAIHPPVLVAMGACERLKNFLVCTGGKKYIDAAVRLTAEMAASVSGSVTLLHVMAEPPAIYADLVRLEEDVDLLLESNSELGRNLRAQRGQLEKLGVTASVRVRHGFVVDEVFNEIAEGDYDIIVTGSSQTRGPLRHYVMGDVTRSILERSNCPVLVARPTTATGTRFWDSVRSLFSGERSPAQGSP